MLDVEGPADFDMIVSLLLYHVFSRQCGNGDARDSSVQCVAHLLVNRICDVVPIRLWYVVRDDRATVCRTTVPRPELSRTKVIIRVMRKVPLETKAMVSRIMAVLYKVL